MSKIKIFLVFHQMLDERLSLSEFSASEVKKWFVPYAVNIDKQPKKLITLDGKEISVSSANKEATIEYELAFHQPMLQARGFLETSCFIHVEKNSLYGNADLVGVTQYDMRWTERSARLLRTLSKHNHDEGNVFYKLARYFGFVSDPQKTVYAQIAGKVMDASGAFNGMACASIVNWDYLLQSYNQFFGTNWSFADLKNQPLTLWQTYLMPRQQFIALAQWLSSLCEELEPWADKAPHKTHWGALAGYTERAEALFIALRYASGEIFIKSLYLEHENSISVALKVSKDHYEN